jgi:phage terminase Nu1 subunit (DNA packaging protein)
MEQQWISLAALAEARGVTPQAISQNLQKWANRSTLPPKMRREGKQKLFVLAGEYERLEAEVAVYRGNGTKRTDLNYAREQARKISIEADLKDLELRQRRGELVPTADVTQAAEICAEILRRQLQILQIGLDADLARLFAGVI